MRSRLVLRRKRLQWSCGCWLQRNGVRILVKYMKLQQYGGANVDERCPQRKLRGSGLYRGISRRKAVLLLLEQSTFVDGIVLAVGVPPCLILPIGCESPTRILDCVFTWVLSRHERHTGHGRD